jgi:hypothetical protein
MLLLVLVLVLCVVGDGDGDGEATPTVGISPAKAGTERTHVRISAIPSRFMACSCLRITRNLASGNETIRKERFLAR